MMWGSQHPTTSTPPVHPQQPGVVDQGGTHHQEPGVSQARLGAGLGIRGSAGGGAKGHQAGAPHSRSLGGGMRERARRSLKSTGEASTGIMRPESSSYMVVTS